MAQDELIYGLHAVAAALRHEPGRIRRLWLESGGRGPRLRELAQTAREQGIAVHESPRNELDRLCAGARHQGAAARLAGLDQPHWAEADLDRLLVARTAPLLLVLDGIQDPHNLGACLRSADAAGVDAVLGPADRAAGLTPVVRKVASGAAETVPLVTVTNLARALRRLRDQGLWLVGASGDAESRLYDADLRGPLAVVLGSEGRGLRRLTREHCDRLVRIPMAGRVESLNVSVATGIVLFEAVRQRSASVD